MLPASLAARTATVVLLVLAIVQAVGLGIYTRDQEIAHRVSADRAIGMRLVNIFRTLSDVPPSLREAERRRLGKPAGVTRLSLDTGPKLGTLPPSPPRLQRILQLNFDFAPFPHGGRPSALLMGGTRQDGRFAFALRFPDSAAWLNLEIRLPRYGWLDDPTFAVAWLMMTLTASCLMVWAVRRLTAPVRTLARAAEALGRDVNAAPLPEDGPREVALAAAAFNTMADRIRRFVSDRTLMLTAIGHDLRTPITRLKLRCEFIDDDELRTRFLGDLDELEQMVSATLAFGRDVGRTEAASPLDLAALLRTVLDDATDARPDDASRIVFASDDKDRVTIRGRPLALKRSFANLVQNALAYAGNVAVSLPPSPPGEVVVLVEDDGPGIPPDEWERVFEPFRRLEASRSRETGGTGLGLSIARNIMRAHGGEVTLSNRPSGGLRARVVLPA